MNTHDIYRPVEERVRDFREVERRLAGQEVADQAGRCHNCGIPFCHGAGCPLGNRIPDQNLAIRRGDWKRAWELLSGTSDFPEFTSRVCPALCEGACVRQLDEGSPVMVRQCEKLIVETAFARGYAKPEPPAAENGKRAAVVGSGPAGLSAARTLRKRGWAVTVFEKERGVGGLLRYGIPLFKLDKAAIDRRRALLEAEGIGFTTGTEVGKDVSGEWLLRRFDAVVVAVGTPAARDLAIPGRDLGGIHFALEFLGGQNRALLGETDAPAVSCEGKRVLVIGGGDTGSDCVGTARRQGAKSVVQVDINPAPPADRAAWTPWPAWPVKFRVSSSHEEGCDRRWQLGARRFLGEGGAVRGVEFDRLDWTRAPDGRPLSFAARPGGTETIEADVVLLAMGFVGVPADMPLARQLGLAPDGRGRLVSDPARGVFCVGDCANGPSLVVRALASGKSLAV